MITAEELVLELNNTEESKNFKLATVVDLFDNDTAKIQFDGEDTPSEKQYAYLKSYIPDENDRVLLAALGGTYIILGKVNFNESPIVEEEYDRYVFDLKTVNILKGLKVSGGLETDTFTSNNGASVIGNIGVNGNIMAVGISATGVVTGASLEVAGQVKGNSLNITSAVSVPGLTSTAALYANSTFQHRGANLGFFNTGATSQRQVPLYLPGGGTATLDGLRLKINELISALNAYGLIRT